MTNPILDVFAVVIAASGLIVGMGFSVVGLMYALRFRAQIQATVAEQQAQRKAIDDIKRSAIAENVTIDLLAQIATLLDNLIDIGRVARRFDRSGRTSPFGNSAFGDAAMDHKLEQAHVHVATLLQKKLGEFQLFSPSPDRRRMAANNLVGQGLGDLDTLDLLNTVQNLGLSDSALDRLQAVLRAQLQEKVRPSIDASTWTGRPE